MKLLAAGTIGFILGMLFLAWKINRNMYPRKDASLIWNFATPCAHPKERVKASAYWYGDDNTNLHKSQIQFNCECGASVEPDQFRSSE